LEGAEDGRRNLGSWQAAGERDEVWRGLKGDGGVCVAAEDALDGCGGVEACCYAATEGFDTCDSVGRGARDDNVNGCSQLLRILQSQLAFVQRS
jgi:hypothetical protein